MPPLFTVVLSAVLVIKACSLHIEDKVHDNRHLLNAAGHVELQRATRMKGLFPFYHSTDELRSEVARLSQMCAVKMNVTTITDSGVSIDVITIRKEHAKPHNRVFLLFGEHSRELISPESGLYFLRILCGDVEAHASANPMNVLEKAEFQIVLNSNPLSRRRVEEGEFCLRADERGVDLNRNWDSHWRRGTDDVINGGPGPHPFSEAETRIFKHLVTEYAPTTFLTIHSGTRGMYMPWAFEMHDIASRNNVAMMEILERLDKDYCQCPFGAAGTEVGYSAPGTCLDYVYGELKTPFAFAYEIYSQPSSEENLRARFKDQVQKRHQQVRAKKSLRKSSNGPGRTAATSDYSYASDATGHATGLSTLPNMMCFETFNPTSKIEYEQVVKNWAEAYIQTAAATSEKLLLQSSSDFAAA